MLLSQKSTSHANFSFHRLKVLEIISTGGYGKVFKAVKKDDGKIYAMKVISKSQVLLICEIINYELNKNYCFYRLDLERQCCTPS